MATTSLARSSVNTYAKYDKATSGNPTSGNIFVMGGPYSQNNFATSSDGITWTLRTYTGFAASTGVVKVDNYYVSSTSGGLVSGILDPVNGPSSVTFGQFPNIGTSNTFQGWNYTNGRFAWFGDYGWAWNSFMNSSQVPGTNVSSFVYANGVWVIIRANNIYYANAASTAPMPSTWTNATYSLTGPQQIAYGNGVFVVTGSNGIASSTDGITWTTRSTAGNFQNSKIVYANGLFLTAINGGNLYTSPDGITWTSRSPVMTSALIIAAAYGAGLWVVMSSTGALWTSPDGTTWTSRTNVFSGNNWYAGGGAYGPSTIYFG